MATAVSTKPPAPKIKRPPPPFVQTGVNGNRPSQPSPSPSSANRASGVKQPGVATPVSASSANGLARPLSRPRSTAQKPGDSTRLQRPSTRLSGADGDRRQQRRFPEPYVKSTAYILKKYAKYPPSLTIHLHPTHFRFDQQDGSFPYNSEMKAIIEHIRDGTVPHDLIEELIKSNVKFYENCLIVRVVDHKSASAQASSSAKSSSGEKTAPYSLHNYNAYITPSPLAPYPQQTHTKSKPTSERRSSMDQSSETQQSPETAKNAAESTDRNQSSSEADEPKAPAKPRVFTTVLHPTAQSLQAELTLLSMTPDPRAGNRRQSQTYPGRASGSVSQTATSLSAIPSSPVTERGPPAKRQKMMVEPHELQEFESKMIKATAAPLYLDPVDSAAASQNLLKFLESPLHRAKPPSPKTRRRTVAELAADEALAAEEERFMLIMDERLAPATAAGAAGAKSAVDDETGAAPYEPRFVRFKTIESIRLQHEENAKREHERKLQQDLAKRQQQEAEREKRRAIEQRQAEEEAREESRRQQLASQQAQQAHIAAAQAAAAQNRRPPSQGGNVMMAGHHPQAQSMVGVSQTQQPSPVIRNITPHNTSSPLVGHAMSSGPPQAIPMAPTSSAQGAGSPVQVTGPQHGHPGMMGHPMTASRSQQGHSRNSTPQMPQGTPAMSHATPVMRNATPTQRMTHASPIASTMAQTPVMNHAMAPNPQMNGMGMTPQQQHAMLQRQMLAQQNMSQGGHQLTPQQMAQLQANAHAQQNIQQAQQHHLIPQHQQHPQPQPGQQHPNMPFGNAQAQQAYQAQLMRNQLAQMQTTQHQQQHPGQSQQQMMLAAAQNGIPPQQIRANMSSRYTTLYTQHLARARQDMANKLMPQFGPPQNYPPELRNQYTIGLERSSKAFIQELMQRERGMTQQRAQLAAAQAQMQQQQHQHMMNSQRGQ